MKTEWEKFIELSKELSDSSNKKSERDIIILLGIYGEYITNNLLKNKCSKISDNDIKSQDLKLKILFELGKFSESEYDVLSKLNFVRNKYAHKLELSEKEINSIKESMKNITINWDKNNENPDELENLMKEDPFLKFILACITKIGYFLTKIGKEKGEKINQTIIFGVRIKGKNYKFKAM